jgi:hypothetical protein
MINHDTDKYNKIYNQWEEGDEVDYLRRRNWDDTSPDTPPVLGFWGELIEDIYDVGNIGDFHNISGANMSFFEGWTTSSALFQPDIYLFNFLGYSGKFYINPETDEIVILDKKEHLIFKQDSENWDPEQNGWKATLPNGVVVFFQDLEKVYQSVTPPDCSAMAPSLTWKITRIELKNGDQITFNYTNTSYTSASISDYDIHSYEDDADYQINRYKSGGSLDLPGYTPIYCTTVGNPVQISNNLKVLTQITSPKYTVNFNTVAGELKPRLASMEIIENHDASFKIGYDFSLSPFNCADGSWHQWTRRNGVLATTATAEENFIKYKLTSLQKYSIDNGQKHLLANPYKFEYHEDIGLPSILSFAQDHWGYYNGEHDNKGLIPDETQMYANEGPYPVASLPNPYDYQGLNDLRKRANSNRGASRDHMIQGTLKKIIYPTTGYTLFNFEPHQFHLSYDGLDDYLLMADEMVYSGGYYIDNYTGSHSGVLSTGAGIRIKEILNYDTDGQFINRKKFDYGETGILLEPLHFWHIERKVQVIDHGHPLNHWQYFDDRDTYFFKTWTASSSNHSTSFAIPNAVGYSSVEVADSDSEMDHINEKINGTTTYSFHNYESVYNLDLGRVSVGYLDSRNGLPTGITYRDESGTVIKSTGYHYTKINSSIFLSMAAKHIGPNSITGFNIFKFEYTPMRADWWKKDWEEEFDQGVTRRTDYLYATDAFGNGRLLSQTTESSSSEPIEVKYYYVDDNPSDILTTSQTLMEMKNANMVNIPLKTEKLVGGRLTEGSITNYGSNLYPSSSYRLQAASYQLEQTLTYDQGKVTQYQGPDGVDISFLWGYGNTLPIAKAVGAKHNTLSTAYTAVGGDLTVLRNHSSLSSAMVSTYTYKPLSGISSQVDPANITTKYDFDEFGRLESLKDNNHHIVQAYAYNYIESPTLSVDVTNLDFGSGSGNKVAVVSSNVSWTAAGNKSWITSVSPSGGSGNANISISVSANDLAAIRNGTVTISDNGGSLPDQVIGISQAAATPYLTVSDNTVDLHGDDYGEVNISANVNWNHTVSYYQGDEWLELNFNPSSDYSGTLEFNVNSLPSSGFWEASVTVSGGGIARHILVTLYAF